MNTKNVMYALTSTFVVITVIGFIDYILLSDHRAHYEHHKKLQQNKVIDHAKALFEVMVIMRDWNANLDAVYIKSDTLKPNPYLLNNSIKSENNETLLRVNPAWMTRQIAETATQTSDFIYKITALKPLNPLNAPDPFERKALEYLQSNPHEKYYYEQNSDFEYSEHFNLMGSLTVKPTCLRCHAEQKYGIGDLRGGIRVSVPLYHYQKNIDALLEEYVYTKKIILFTSVVIGIFILLLFNMFVRYQRGIKKINNYLNEKVKHRTHALKQLNKKLEERIKNAVEANKTNEKLMITQSRNAAMGEMISMIAHQWRQPLSEISMVANNIAVDIELDAIDNKSLKSDINGIVEQTAHLSKTIDDFANFFKPDRKRECVCISSVCVDAIEILKKMLDKNGIVICMDLRCTQKIMTYKRELLHVIVNVLKNARDAYLDRALDARRIWISTCEHNTKTTISISDHAGGIDDVLLEKIFEPYFTTKPNSNGTGLGLYIAKIIVENHLDGTIKVKNIGGGVQFNIVFNDALTCEKNLQYKGGKDVGFK